MKTTPHYCRTRELPITIITVSEPVSGIGELGYLSKQFACSSQKDCEFRYDPKVCFLRHLQIFTK